MQVSHVQIAARPAPPVMPATSPASGHGYRDPFVQIGVRKTIAAGRPIFRQGEKAEFIARVLSGATRSYRVLADGRRQITQFQFAGDVLGLEAEKEHRFTAEALEDAVVLYVRRSSLTRLAEIDGRVAGALWSVAVSGQRRSQDHALLLSRQGACERLAAFLLDLVARLDADLEIDLSMSRQDIADYLGLTIHTVSRSFSELQSRGWITARGPRRIRLERAAELRALCG